MSDWFDDGFYKEDPERSAENTFKEVEEHFQKINMQINKMFTDTFKPLMGIAYGEEQHDASAGSKGKEVPRTRSSPIVEEPDESRPAHSDYFYSSTTRKYTGPDGITHIQRKIDDRKSGTRQMIETRKIGDRSLTIKNEIDKSGHSEQSESKENIKDDEVDAFRSEWESRRAKLPPIGNRAAKPSSSRLALK